MITRRELFIAGAATAAAGPALAQGTAARPVLRLGVLGDFSGPYRHLSGPTNVACVRQAVADFTAANPSVAAEVVFADHQQKPDTGVAIARQWFDRDGVDVVLELNNSAIALAVNGLVREKDKVHLNTGAITMELTGAQCSPNTIHWTYDSWMLAHSTGVATVRAGGSEWFFIAADNAFATSMDRDLRRFIEGAGGRVRGVVRYPFPGTTDFSSYLLQAQGSRANTVALINAGADFINCVKQAREFGLNRRGVNVAGMIVFVNDIVSLGLETAQGLRLTEAFYWDLNDRTRAFTRRVLPATPDNYPNMCQAGAYSAALHYLKAAADLGPAAAKASGRAVVERMKAMPTDDDVFGPGSIRPDGRKIHPVYLFEVKRPEESRGTWDVYKPVVTVPIDEAFRPMGEGNCALVRG
ncbi:ABC transporter substrate-binding protein [Roseomonas sp. NAR14]|uniref:ABC transporter substrate-binding protein n=1 Tax=Roseomonas acroporae TaxID=2937791 RepID=A0A9X1Y6P1_9PROT|nr:ABC transporter substrate-binding protein [Roseomonas acroporae]MCK8784959.1 ABC transporter substrate-binding protein [Roseomonas acroporae]